MNDSWLLPRQILGQYLYNWLSWSPYCCFSLRTFGLQNTVQLQVGDLLAQLCGSKSGISRPLLTLPDRPTSASRSTIHRKGPFIQVQLSCQWLWFNLCSVYRTLDKRFGLGLLEAVGNVKLVYCQVLLSVWFEACLVVTSEQMYKFLKAGLEILLVETMEVVFFTA